jgi:hypothetical protein
VILAEPAAYLECTYDRAQALRVIRARLLHQINRTYDTHDPDRRERLRARLTRAQRHLDAMTGGAA